MYDTAAAAAGGPARPVPRPVPRVVFVDDTLRRSGGCTSPDLHTEKTPFPWVSIILVYSFSVTVWSSLPGHCIAYRFRSPPHDLS